MSPSEPARPSLSQGFLAALPLFAAYEVGGFARGADRARAAAEKALFLGGEFVGERLPLLRTAALLVLAALAWWRVRRAVPDASPRGLARLVLTGILAGVLLGPVLVALQAWLGATPLGAASEPRRTLLAVLRLVGAAPWEEALFRVALYGALFLAVRRVAVFLGLVARAAQAVAELASVLGSAVLFAAFHLDGVQRELDLLGEPFHRGLFLWRISAGVLLAALFRWRGFGVSAWAHAVFNLGIALGIRA